ncbi:MAG: DUF1285 domain-containing protein [Thalassovita sp.]
MAKIKSEQMSVKPKLDGIAAAIRANKGEKGLPPVHLWSPPFCGDLDIRIARDGTWFYLGTPIGRPELVRLFSTILRKDDDKYYLVTPVEKIGITVDDVPFLAIDFQVKGEDSDQILTFTTSVGDDAVAGPDHAITVTYDPDTQEPSPYVHIRADLTARIDRKSFYRLVDLCTDHVVEGISWFGLWSSGVFFPVIPTDQLNPKP